MRSPIYPTVGRVVLFVDYGSHVTCAMVTRVHSDECVNLMVMHDGQTPTPRTSVVYDETGEPGTWHWMDYQRAKAASDAFAEEQAAEERANPNT